jgi:hypothetical protein
MDLPSIAIVVISVANLCLLVRAAFYRECTVNDGEDPRFPIRFGYISISLGLCSQILYGLMVGASIYGWVPFDLGYNSVQHLQGRFSSMGGMMSAATILVALFGRGLRRLTGLWVGATNWFLWGLVGLGAGLDESLTGLLRELLRALLRSR